MISCHIKVGVNIMAQYVLRYREKPGRAGGLESGGSGVWGFGGLGVWGFGVCGLGV